MILDGPVHSPPDRMPEAIGVELGQRMAEHPWWRHRRELVVEELRRRVAPPSRVLDVGCGAGLTLLRLEADGYRVAGLEAHRELLERLDAPGRLLVHADVSLGAPGGLGPFQAVLLLDVLEHLAADAVPRALATIRGLLVPGGVLVVSVPARQDLYSSFDAVQGHLRRYSPRTLREALAVEGMRVEEMFWWGAWMVPLFRVRRLLRRQRPGEPPVRHYERFMALPPAIVGSVLDLAFRLDGRRTRARRNRTGTSLFAIVVRES